MIIYLLQTKCHIEGLQLECGDNPNWVAVDKSGGKHYCKDIGVTASCYDRDMNGTDGWKVCLKTCGNCAKTEVSQAPMNILATYSGDPYETFEKVPAVSKDRQWVGKGAGGGKDDIRGYIDTDVSEDIIDLQDRLDSVQGIFDMISGNIKHCKPLAGKGLATAIKDREKTKVLNKDKKDKYYAGCNNTALKCPHYNSEAKDVTTASIKGIEKQSVNDTAHSYIKETCSGVNNDNNCSIQFPAYTFKCGDIDKALSLEDKCKKVGTYTPKGSLKSGCYYSFNNQAIDLTGKITHLNAIKNTPESPVIVYPTTTIQRKKNKNFEDNTQYLFVPNKWYEGLTEKSGTPAKDYCVTKSVAKGSLVSDQLKAFPWLSKSSGSWVRGGFKSIWIDNPEPLEEECKVGNTTYGPLTNFPVEPSNVPTADTCDSYYLFDKVTDTGDTKGKTKSSKKVEDKITLGDMCPWTCGKCQIK